MRKRKFSGLIPEQLWSRARRLVFAAKRIDPEFSLARLAEVALERVLPSLEKKYGVDASAASEDTEAKLPPGRPMKAP